MALQPILSIVPSLMMAKGVSVIDLIAGLLSVNAQVVVDITLGNIIALATRPPSLSGKGWIQSASTGMGNSDGV